jgi:hypothetical protein
MKDINDCCFSETFTTLKKQAYVFPDRVKIMRPRGTHIYFKLLCPKYSLYYALLAL